MQYDDFIGQVQDQARLPSTGDTVRAISATLQTLAMRLHGGEADDLAAQLPQSIGEYLKHDGSNETFGLSEFYNRVQKRSGFDMPDAVHNARAVMQVLQKAVTGGEMHDIKTQLPAEYNELFEPMN